MDRRAVGKKGEEMALEFLIQKGYEVLGKNYHKRVGEIDLIVKDPTYNEIVFVEVKARRTRTFGPPEEAVTQNKLEKIEKAALNWLSENNVIDQPWRIDIIALEFDKENMITHLENVTI